MAEEFAINDEFDATANDDVVNNGNEANDPIDSDSDKENLSGGEENIRNHIVKCGVFAVFWSFVFRKWPLFSAGSIEGISEDCNKKHQKDSFGGAIMGHATIKDSEC